jgi:hypothetical protein
MMGHPEQPNGVVPDRGEGSRSLVIPSAVEGSRFWICPVHQGFTPKNSL